MIADSYYLIRREQGLARLYVVSMGFASNEEPPQIRPSDPRFDSLADAIHYANFEPAEYGVQFHSTALAG